VGRRKRRRPIVAAALSISSRESYRAT